MVQLVPLQRALQGREQEVYKIVFDHVVLLRNITHQYIQLRLRLHFSLQVLQALVLVPKAEIAIVKESGTGKESAKEKESD